MKKTRGMGRPSEYKEEYNQKVDEYLVLCQDEENEFHKTRGDKSNSYERVTKVKLPTLEGFALFIGVNKTSLYAWDKIHPNFSNSLDKIRIEQQRRLIDKGLSGEYNPVIAKLVLSANHGLRERTDITTNDLPLPILGNVSKNHSNTKDSESNEKD